MVADYESGMPTIQLTERYGLCKASVLRLLHEAGTEMRIVLAETRLYRRRCHFE